MNQRTMKLWLDLAYSGTYVKDSCDEVAGNKRCVIGIARDAMKRDRGLADYPSLDDAVTWLGFEKIEDIIVCSEHLMEFDKKFDEPEFFGWHVLFEINDHHDFTIPELSIATANGYDIMLDDCEIDKVLAELSNRKQES